MSYSVKEIYYTIQGEGHRAGTPNVFLRFAGCNLWSGKEEDRASAICKFCDTDFLNGETLNLGQLMNKVRVAWRGDTEHKAVVLTGGEPMLQVDRKLIDALQTSGFYVAIETNGTIDVPIPIDWITVSPKEGSKIKQFMGDELKFVFPQGDLPGREYHFDHYYVQPMDGPDLVENTRLCVEFVKSNPSWKLSLQTHKMIGIR